MRLRPLICFCLYLACFAFAFKSTVSSAQTVVPMYSFTGGSDGYEPSGGVTLGVDTLYGTTTSSQNNESTIFSINTNGLGFETIYSLAVSTNGSSIESPLLLTNGILYGTAYTGGSNDNGTVFSVSTNGSHFDVLYTFVGPDDGAGPNAGVVLSDGTLYGVTYEGGSNGYGTVFSVGTNGSNFTALYTFNGTTDNGYPLGTLVVSNDTLYGTASGGFDTGAGVVFSIKTNGVGFSVLHTFSGTDGFYPETGLTLFSNVLYGSTSFGGADQGGALFSIHPDGTQFQTLYTFTNGTDGSYPGSPLLANNGLLFGSANEGGTYDEGTMFTINPNGTSFTVTHTFTGGADGADPNGPVVIANDVLFGAAQFGGASGDGLIFSQSFVNEDLGISAVVTPSSFNAGDTITNTITVINYGISDSGEVMVTNTYSSDWSDFNVLEAPGSGFIIGNTITFDIGTLPVGVPATLVVTAVASGSNQFGSISAGVFSQNLDTNLANNATNLTVQFGGEGLTLGVTTTSTADVQVNDVVGFSLSVTNFGPSANGNITVTNVLSPLLGNVSILSSPVSVSVTGDIISADVGTLAVGQSATIIFTATALNLGTVTNTAFVSSPFYNPDRSNAVSTIVFKVIPAPPPIVSFSISAVAGSAFVTVVTATNSMVQLQYGTSPAYGQITSVTGPALTNVTLLSGLAVGVTYYVNALVYENGNVYSTNQSFTTSGAVVLSTQDADYSGFWAQGSESTPGIYTNGYFNVAATQPDGTTSSATYTPTIPVAGVYDISIWYPENSAFCSNTLVYLTGTTNTVITSVNQSINGGQWVPMGPLYMGTGNSGNVTLYTQPGEVNVDIAANAMMWSYDLAQDNIFGVVPAWWTAYYFGTNAVSSPTNYTAYVFGVAPGQTTNVPAMSVSATGSNSVAVQFSPYIGGRFYQLQATTNLSSTNWITLTNQPSVSTNATSMYTNGTGAGVFNVTTTNTLFFRIAAQLAL